MCGVFFLFGALSLLFFYFYPIPFFLLFSFFTQGMVVCLSWSLVTWSLVTFVFFTTQRGVVTDEREKNRHHYVLSWVFISNL